ncbi:hypothetical protein [Yersinia kristensenii]|uniref:hypothetical protein n=1 Tax=Yersinia kristensenii TaxID=28152 RepID=UPI00119F7DA4|nr:hypothetical protein [Yersinia kristensenii]
MNKSIISLAVLILAGCGMSPNEIKSKPTAKFESNKSVTDITTCLIPRLDERTFNGVRINTVSKPIEHGVSLSPIAANIEFIDITNTGAKTQVIYYGAGTGSALRPKARINETVEDINSCI